MSPVTTIAGQMPSLRSIAEEIRGMVIHFQHEMTISSKLRLIAARVQFSSGWSTRAMRRPLLSWNPRAATKRPTDPGSLREALGNKGQKASHAFLLFGLNYLISVVGLNRAEFGLFAVCFSPPWSI